jgi:hypothetical protein
VRLPAAVSSKAKKAFFETCTGEETVNSKMVGRFEPTLKEKQARNVKHTKTLPNGPLGHPPSVVRSRGISVSKQAGLLWIDYFGHHSLKINRALFKQNASDCWCRLWRNNHRWNNTDPESVIQ